MIISSCSTNERSKNDFIYRNYFLHEVIDKTLDPHNDLRKLSELNDIPDSLIDDWVLHFRASGHHANKMISYQFGGKNYHALIIGVIDELYIDNDHNVDNSYSIMNQYILTTNDSGKFIDGILVQEYIYGGDLDSVANGKIILNKNIWSQFKKDTIIVEDKTNYLKETVLSEREDYAETPEGKKMEALEMVLDEEYEGIDETTYVISPNGKIMKVGDKKGKLKKVM